MYTEQIPISSKNKISLPIQSNFQEFVIPWIATLTHELNDGNEFGGASELT